MFFMEYRFLMLLIPLSLVSFVCCGDGSVRSYLVQLSQEFPDINASIFNHETNENPNPESCDLDFTFISKVSGKGFHRVLEFSFNSLPSKSVERVQIFQRLRPEVFVDPFELQHLSFSWKLEGLLDLETPAPGSQATLLIIQNSTIGPLTLNLTLPLHVKYQKPIKCDSCSIQRGWLSTGPFVEFQLDAPRVLVFSAGCKHGLKGNQVEISVPTGNLDHLKFVLLASLVVLLLSTGFILWNLVFTKECIDTKKE